MSSRNPPADDDVWHSYKAVVQPKTSRPRRVTAAIPSLPKAERLSRSTNVAMTPVALDARKRAVASLPRIEDGDVLDREESRKLRLGDLRIGARIDLHGMTQAKAHEALLAFLDHAIANGKKTLLVITGQGAGGQGVLRRAVPLWLYASPWRNAIRHISHASLKHGGAGAYYVLLRKSAFLTKQR